MNTLYNKVRNTNYYDEEKVFELGVELSLLGRELMCKCIDNQEGGAYLTKPDYFKWFRH